MPGRIVSWAKLRGRDAMHALIGGAGRTKLGQVAFQNLLESVVGRTQAVTHNGVSLAFVVPNEINQWRVDTFSTKEPETLRWIDEIPAGSVLWDIGANVGLYSCYAAKARNCRVFAFEPSVFNLGILARNNFLNGASAKVTIIPLPLCGARSLNRLRMTSTELGGALSTFGEEYGFDGKPINATFDFQTVGLSMTEACSLLAIPQPDFVKIDVDGTEHVILEGGGDVLRNVLGLLVEINDDFHAQAETAECLLEAAGLVLREKHRLIEEKEAPASVFAATYNQIWTRETPPL